MKEKTFSAYLEQAAFPHAFVPKNMPAWPAVGVGGFIYLIYLFINLWIYLDGLNLFLAYTLQMHSQIFPPNKKNNTLPVVASKVAKNASRMQLSLSVLFVDFRIARPAFSQRALLFVKSGQNKADGMES